MEYILIILLVLVVLGIFIVSLESGRELRTVRLTRYTIKDDIPESLAGKEIVFISDFHEAEGGLLNDRIVSLIDSVRPEMILVGGDMVNSSEDLTDELPSISLLNTLAESYPVLYAYGNHEKRFVEDVYATGTDWSVFIDRLDTRIELLDNRSISPIEGLSVAGLDVPIEYYNRMHWTDVDASDIETLLGKKEGYTILLAHSPELYEAGARWGADLVLSGHFHGGIVRIPGLGGVVSPRLRLFPKHDYGMYQESGSRLIVTNGLGQHSIKLRLNNIPEVVIISFNGL